VDIIFPEKWILGRSGRELVGLKGKGTYFCNYALYDETKPRPHGALFTHLEDKWRDTFDEVASKVDYAVCMNKTVKKYLEDKGVKHVEIIPHGYDPRVKKEPVFGFSGRKYKSGRKATELLPPETIWSEDFDKQPEFYKKIDYLLLPARIEGGPVPLLDAIAAGVPVIAREGVGWVDEYPCIRFKTDEEFKKIIHQLKNPPQWIEWRTKHKSLFSLMS